MDPEASPKVKELRQKLADAFDVKKTENEIYSDLYNFFKRYYSEGDFLSLRRYKDGVYALPYEGQEVKLHWANADQYYIKSSEDLTNYTFKIADKKIRFEVVDAKLEQNNNKGDANRRFKLVEQDPVRTEDGAFIISFSYLPDAAKTKQEVLNKQIEEKLLTNSVLQPILSVLTANTNSGISALLHHINNFTAKHTFDYFIHKDLGGFLKRELDFYIKNEIMHLDDIESDTAQRVESYLCKVKVFKSVANKIIAFLTSLEEFQKKLWLKKKFVWETNYCITLDRVPEALYDEICNNSDQIKEWINLFAINELDGFSNPLRPEFLKTNKYLVLDTAFFSTDFKYKLIGDIDNLDQQCNGLLIHSENFQALNLLQEKYKEKIKTIYIDPPYNAKTSEILYKNNYKHSSWLSLMENRLVVSKCLQPTDGNLIVAIDENEQDRLGLLLQNTFPEKLLTAVSCVHNTRGIQGNNFSYNHETYYFSYEDKSGSIAPRILDEGIWEKFRNWGGNSARELGYAMFFPIRFKKQKNGYIVDSIGEAPAQDFHPDNANIWINDEIIEVWPIDDNGTERKWRYSKDSTIENLKKNPNFIRLSKIGNQYQIEFYKTKEQYRTCWVDKKYDASIYGSKILNSIVGPKKFDFPKSLYTVVDSILPTSDDTSIILDYFAGSATTGHAVIKLSRDNKDSNRKYFLVEMGKYFDRVTKPRIEKVIYSSEWDNTKPVGRDGISQCFKYIRLESYEDTLDNLQFYKTQEQTDLLNSTVNKSIKEQYMLNYMMDLETKDSLLNVSDFNRPYDYEMKITRDGETKTVKVDLVETFNYLIGLNVTHMQMVKNVLAIEGITRDGQRTLVLWRNTDEVSNKDLDTWFEKQKYSTKDMEFDLIYVNGNNNLENLRKSDETWKVRLTEDEFLKRMFDVKDI
jgi:adenine-specific DNA-methyltransferase